MKKIIIGIIVSILVVACIVIICIFAFGNTRPNDTINNPQQQGAKQVDYDLSAMGKSMAYSTVVNVKENPLGYIGKTFKVSGVYKASFYDVTQQYYHYILIIDSTACCQTAIEFVYNGKTYPTDFPSIDANITIEGTFGSYQEEDITYYCIFVTSLTVIN
ncbi:MAG: hypothetical protein PHW00_05120 [Clostridia bacterium]|nr:hypothetical protein [Clostridia bacterium]